MAGILDQFGRAVEYRATNKNPTDWLIEAIGGGWRTASGERVSQEAAMSVMAWYACVRNISEDIAMLPKKVRIPVEPRGSRALPEHPIAKLFRYPNEETNAHSFWETIMGMALQTKGGMAEIIRDGEGTPVGWYLLDPDAITVIRNRAGEIAYKHIGMDENTAIRARDVLHIHGPGDDGICGSALLRLASEVLGTAIALQKFRGAFFGNGANPSGILKHPSELTEQAAERLRRDFERRYSGGANANGVMLLEEGMDWVAVSTDPEKSQMVESSGLSVEEICRAFRMPPHKIGYLKDAHYANAEQGEIIYRTDTLSPWISRIKSEIEFKMLRPEEREQGIFVDIVINALMHADVKTRDEHYKTHYYLGTMSQNDILELEDRDLIDGGDTYYIQRNIIPMDRVNEVIDSETSKGMTPPDSGDNQPNPGTQNARAAMTMLLENKLQYVLTIEADRIRQSQTMDKFYTKFEKNVREQVLPIMQAIAMVSASGMDHAAISDEYASDHCALSIQNLEQGDVSNWANGRRAKEEAERIAALFFEEALCNTAA